ncbi:hypothetical protein [Yinghuangia seranimata]|uniref:hypothetical protein n=1 Tax=Yinghuangia seranimata TaxID=408067 RepID=UPI00248AC7B8|nr:hypothetical protein [Yinghuangia seranimata]MDI2127049.1 hypothetical protein [Yinghuangia seranimata]
MHDFSGADGFDDTGHGALDDLSSDSLFGDDAGGSDSLWETSASGDIDAIGVPMDGDDGSLALPDLPVFEDGDGIPAWAVDPGTPDPWVQDQINAAEGLPVSDTYNYELDEDQGALEADGSYADPYGSGPSDTYNYELDEDQGALEADGSYADPYGSGPSDTYNYELDEDQGALNREGVG